MKNKKTSLRLLLVIILLLMVTESKIFAQSINRDSLRREKSYKDSVKQDSILRVSRIQDFAKLEARGKRLSHAENLRFMADKKNSNSDLFKPDSKYVFNTAFLFDSVYVKTFRMAAYQMALYDNSKIEKSFWLAFGLGANIGSYEEGGGINLFTNANLELSNFFLITSDIQLNATGFGGHDEENYSILIGKILKKRTSFITVSSGLAYNNEYTIGSTLGNLSASGLGIPILIQGYSVIAHTVGFGIHVYAFWSAARTTAGISLSLAFGRLLKHDGKLTD